MNFNEARGIITRPSPLGWDLGTRLSLARKQDYITIKTQSLEFVSMEMMESLIEVCHRVVYRPFLGRGGGGESFYTLVSQ